MASKSSAAAFQHQIETTIDLRPRFGCPTGLRASVPPESCRSLFRGGGVIAAADWFYLIAMAIRVVVRWL
jgi:hypothetical protein